MCIRDSSYVIIYRSYILSKMVRVFLAHPQYTRGAAVVIAEAVGQDVGAGSDTLDPE